MRVQRVCSSLEARLHAMMDASSAETGPCVVVQTLGTHYACVNSEEAEVLRALVMPAVGDCFRATDSLSCCKGMSEEERRELLRSMRPV